MHELRWQQRFENFEKAFLRLESTLDAWQKNNEDEIYEMALIQAFEFTYELAWKTLKDYLKYNGIEANLPREVIKQSFNQNLIEDGQVWIDMLENRNLMSHTYDDASASKIIIEIAEKYTPAIKKLFLFFKNIVTLS